MGQQQLLLVILVTILVGIATVVGINVFGSSAQQANQDAVRQDIAQIASSAQGWFIKPGMMDGGGNSFSGIDFTKVTFPGEILASDATNTTATNLNGTYKITVNDQDDYFTIQAEASSTDGYTEGTISSATFEVDVLDGDIDWESSQTAVVN